MVSPLLPLAITQLSHLFFCLITAQLAVSLERTFFLWQLFQSCLSRFCAGAKWSKCCPGVCWMKMLMKLDRNGTSIDRHTFANTVTMQQILWVEHVLIISKKLLKMSECVLILFWSCLLIKRKKCSCQNHNLRRVHKDFMYVCQQANMLTPGCSSKACFSTVLSHSHILPIALLLCVPLWRITHLSHKSLFPVMIVPTPNIGVQTMKPLQQCGMTSCRWIYGCMFCSLNI